MIEFQFCADTILDNMVNVVNKLQLILIFSTAFFLSLYWCFWTNRTTTNHGIIDHWYSKTLQNKNLPVHRFLLNIPK